jgi:hypothetical protein
MPQLQLPRVDADALLERVRDVDLSRLADLGDEVRRLDLAEAIRGIDRDALSRLDLEGLRNLAEGLDRPEVDLAALRDSALVRRVEGALGLGRPKRNLWELSMPPLSATIVAGTLIVLAGAVVGGAIAWLFQPGKGDVRRARIRRKLARAMRNVRRTLQPG